MVDLDLYVDLHLENLEFLEHFFWHFSENVKVQKHFLENFE